MTAAFLVYMVATAVSFFAPENWRVVAQLVALAAMIMLVVLHRRARAEDRRVLARADYDLQQAREIANDLEKALARLEKRMGDVEDDR